MLEHRTRGRKIASSNPGRSGGRIFFSRVNFVCWLLFHVRFTPVLPQRHVKDPGYFAESAGGKFHLNTHTSMTQRSQSGLTMPLCRHSVGSIRKRVHTQLVREHSATIVSARALWTDPGLRSGTGARHLISTFKKKKAQEGNE